MIEISELSALPRCYLLLKRDKFYPSVGPWLDGTTYHGE